jgi:CBS domain-containing protein
MKVREVMTDEVAFCMPETNLAEAVALMWRDDCGALPVASAECKVIGIITDRDIAIAVGTRNTRPSELLVGEVMSKDVASCGMDDEIHAALETMRRIRVQRLPVIDKGGILRGIVSINDVLLAAGSEDGLRNIGLTYSDAVNTFKAICERNRRAAKRQKAAAAVE